MHGVPETPPGLVQRLQDSPQRVADSIRASALWLAMLDGPIDPREFHEVGLALTHDPEGVLMQDIVAALSEDPMPRDWSKLLRFLRGQRSPTRTVWLVDLFIRVAAADGRISQIERHALIFLSDLLGAPASLLSDRFEALVGFEFEPPADLSDPAFFEAAEAAAEARQTRQKVRTADVASAARAAEQRRVDLLLLGLKPDATPIATKAAWRRLSRQHHPDRQAQAGADAKREAGLRFDAVQKAWQRLKADDDA